MASPLADLKFLTIAEIAEILRVSKMTVYRLAHSGELESRRIGRSFRITEDAVLNYLEKQENQVAG